MIFDKNWYAFDTDKDKENFLERLVRHEEGLDPAVPSDRDCMLDRFTTDLQQIAQVLGGDLPVCEKLKRILTGNSGKASGVMTLQRVKCWQVANNFKECKPVAWPVLGSPGIGYEYDRIGHPGWLNPVGR